MRYIINQPAYSDPLHPGADQGNGLAGEIQAEIVIAQSPEGRGEVHANFNSSFIKSAERAAKNMRDLLAHPIRLFSMDTPIRFQGIYLVPKFYYH